MPDEYPISAAVRRLREIVDQEPIQGQLMKNRRLWGQICSSMDILKDTDSAIGAYLTTPVADGDHGRLYLHTYGALQAIAVQQDAVIHAAEAIGLPYKLPDDLVQIRDIWDKTVGHPTKHGTDPTESFGIVRRSLSTNGFTLNSFNLDRPGNFQPIQMRQLIQIQQTAVVDAIECMIYHLAPPGPVASMN